MDKYYGLRNLFGQNLKNLRKLNKLTQAQLAEKVEVEPKHISCIENGQSFPSAEVLAKLALALQLKPYELFLFEEKPSVEALKNEIMKILDETSDDNIEKIYLYTKFLAPNTPTV